MTRAAAGFAALLVVCTAALAMVTWHAGVLMSNDAPSHIFEAFVENHYHDDRYGFARWLVVNDDVVTARGFQELFRALEPSLGWREAYRAALVVIEELWALGCVAVLWAASPADAWSRRRWLAPLGFGAAPQLALWFGLLPFLLGTALVMFAVAAWLRASSPRARRPLLLVVAGLLFLAASCHSFPVLGGGVVLGCVTLVRAPDRRARVIELLLLLLASLPALSVVIRSLGAAGQLGVDVDTEFQPLLDRTLFVFSRFVCGPAWRTLGALVLVVTAGVHAIAARRSARVDVALAAAGLVLVVVTCALPEDVAGWQFAGVRLLPLGAVCAWSALPAERRRMGLVVIAAASLWSAASLVWTYRLHGRMAASAAPALTGLDTLPPRPTLWSSIVLLPAGVDDDARVHPRHDPLVRLAHVVALERGGVPYYQQIGVPQVHGLSWREGMAPASMPRPAHWWHDLPAAGEARAGHVRQLLAYAARVPDLVFFGRPDDVDVVLQAGYRAELREGGLFVGRFEGCTGRVRVEGATEPVTIDVGWWPVRSPDQGLVLVPGHDSDEVTLGCGEVWAGVHASSGERRTCRADGAPVRAIWSSGGDNELRCELVAAP